MPLVSVIMVFHRDQPFLRPAIASVLDQSLRDLELVLVDNGTGLAAGALGERGRDPRIRWVRLARNEGIPAGHNAGIVAATGEFIALQDYDDVALPPRLERQVQALHEDPALNFVSALAEKIDERERSMGYVFCLPDSATHFIYSQYAGVVVTAVGMGRREVFQRWPYRPEFPFAADLDFQARMAEAGRMVVIPEVLLRYRWYSRQTTQVNTVSIEQSRCVIGLTTARRRARRPEELAAAWDVVRTASAAESWRRGAKLCLEEGFTTLAAYQARRSFVMDRTARSAAVALRLGLSAWHRSTPGEKALTAKMFLRGPVRAFGLRPA